MNSVSRNNPFNTVRSNKGRDFKPQFELVYNAFYSGVKTMKEVAKELEVDRGNICWIKGCLEKSDRIYLVELRQCKITNSKGVQALTTNPQLAPIRCINQLNLF